MKKIPKFGSQKISSFVIKKAITSPRLNLSQQRQDGRFVAMVTKDHQTLNLKFDQVMFNSLILTREKKF